MQKIFSLGFFLVMLISNVAGQLTQSNWLVGGSAEFNSRKPAGTANTYYSIAPRVGYFFIDKLNAGMNVEFSGETSKVLDTKLSSHNLGLGPFVRYYLLPIDNQVNIFSEANYQYRISKGSAGDKDNANFFLFGAGPSFFLNSSVAIECMAGYRVVQSIKSKAQTNTFMFRVGFQVYLEKE